MDLQARRKELGLTLEEVGNKVGVGKSTVRKWETGYISNMGRDKIVALAKVLRISPLDILDPNRKDDPTDKILSLYSQLTDSKKDDVINYAQKQLDNQQVKDAAMPFVKSNKKIDFPFKGAVSAGTGEWMDDEIHETITLDHEPPANADFALKVNGDSMEPFFENDQIIFVKTVEDPSQVFSNQFVIADLNGEAYLKKIVFEQVGCRLVSLNKKYPDKIVTENDAFYVRGTVVFE
ncbi:MAG: XRE family transcriptional regulator [Lactobacillus sp.]|nr:XRE family transcriptional regulator [Lactobacillus sp.]